MVTNAVLIEVETKSNCMPQYVIMYICMTSMSYTYVHVCISDAPIIGQILEIGLSATFLQHR